MSCIAYRFGSLFALYYTGHTCRGSVANYKVYSSVKNYTSMAFTWEDVGTNSAYTIVKVMRIQFASTKDALCEVHRAHHACLC